MPRRDEGFSFAPAAGRRVGIVSTVVLVVQSFLKIPVLHALASNGNEPPFAVVQAVVLIACIALGFSSARKARRWEVAAQPA